MSSFSDVPPVVTMQCSLGSMCFPISLTMAEVWRASSRVGMSIRTGSRSVKEKQQEHVEMAVRE